MGIIFLIIAVVYTNYNNPRYYSSRSYPYRILDSLVVSSGKEYAKTKKIIITSLARNIINTMKYFMKNIELFSSLFMEVYLLIVEGDSTDGTRGKLLEWKKNNYLNNSNLKIDILGCNGVNLEICNYGDIRIKGFGSDRIDKMVRLRNIYINYIKENDLDDKYDFLVVYDPDIIGDLYSDGIAHTMYYFQKYSDIDGIGVNGVAEGMFSIAFYYDGYAFRHADGTCMENTNHTIYESGLLRVISSFAGCFFYKLPLPKDAIYSSHLSQDGKNVICEHRGFNENFKSLYIDMDNIFYVLEH